MYPDMDAIVLIWCGVVWLRASRCLGINAAANGLRFVIGPRSEYKSRFVIAEQARTRRVIIGQRAMRMIM